MNQIPDNPKYAVLYRLPDGEYKEHSRGWTLYEANGIVEEFSNTGIVFRVTQVIEFPKAIIGST